MTNEIKRDIGTMDAAAMSLPDPQHVYDFFKLELPEIDGSHPAVTFRFAQLTRLPTGFVGDIDGSSQTWVAYDWLPQGLSNTNTSILEVSAVSLANLDGNWTTLNFGYRLQGRRVTIWRAQFDDTDTTLIGKTILFQGKTDEIDCKDRANMTLLPFQSALDVLVPGPTYSRTMCMHIRNYMGPFCQYAGALSDCDGTLDGPNGCRVHDNIIHYGAFPKLPKRGTAVTWGPHASPQHYTL